MPIPGSDPTASRSTRQTIALRSSSTQGTLRHSTALLRTVFEVDDLHQRAAAGNAAAQAEYGQRLLLGQGVSKNKREGRAWCRLAAEQGNALGQFLLGGCYYNGEGGLADLLRAYFWFSLAADQGVKEAIVIRKLMAPRLSDAQTLEVKRLIRAWRPATTTPASAQGDEHRNGKH